MADSKQHTYSLHTCMSLPVDDSPEHVRTKDVVPTLDHEQRMPELCIIAVHLLCALPPECIQHLAWQP